MATAPRALQPLRTE